MGPLARDRQSFAALFWVGADGAAGPRPAYFAALFWVGADGAAGPRPAYFAALFWGRGRGGRWPATGKFCCPILGRGRWGRWPATGKVLLPVGPLARDRRIAQVPVTEPSGVRIFVKAEAPWEPCRPGGFVPRAG